MDGQHAVGVLPVCEDRTRHVPGVAEPVAAGMEAGGGAAGAAGAAAAESLVEAKSATLSAAAVGGTGKPLGPSSARVVCGVFEETDDEDDPSGDDLMEEDEDEVYGEEAEDWRLEAKKVCSREKVVTRRGFQCPVCVSTKADYKFNELYTHTLDQSRWGRRPHFKVKHAELLKFLEKEKESLKQESAGTAARRQFTQSLPSETEEKFLWHPICIVTNIERKWTYDENRKMELWAAVSSKSSLKERLEGYDVQKVEEIWDHFGHTGQAILHFEPSLTGFRMAMKLSLSFKRENSGRWDWFSVGWGQTVGTDGSWGQKGGTDSGWSQKGGTDGSWGQKDGKWGGKGRSGRQLDGDGKQVFGWIATPEDKRDHKLGKKLLKILESSFSEKTEREIDALDRAQKRSTVKALNSRISSMESSLAQRDDEKRVLEQEMMKVKQQHEDEIRRLRAEKDEMRSRFQEDQRQTVRKLRERERQLRADEQRLNATHEEKERARQQVQEVNWQLALQERKAETLANQTRQQELDMQRLENAVVEYRKKLEEIHRNQTEATMKELEGEGEEKGEGAGKKQGKGTADEDAQRKVQELLEELQETKEELEDFQTQSNQVVGQKQQLQEQHTEAMRFALKLVTEVMGDNQIHAVVEGFKENEASSKKAKVLQKGCLNKGLWTRTLKLPKTIRSDKDEKAVVKYTELFSEWEEKLKDPLFSLHKVVEKNGKPAYQEISDHEDLTKLKADLGSEVAEPLIKDIFRAMLELEEHNASGRYPVKKFWNVEANRESTMTEVIERLAGWIKILVEACRRFNQQSKTRSAKRLRAQENDAEHST